MGRAERPELTSIQVAVKVNDGDGSISPVDGSQQGKCDGMVAAERDDTRKSLSLLRRPSLVGVGGGTPREDIEVAFFDLVQGPSVVISATLNSATGPSHEMYRLVGTDLRGDGNITTVEDGRPAVERVGFQGDVVATAISCQYKSGAIWVIMSLTRDSVAWIPDGYRTVQNGRPDGKTCRCRMEHLGRSI